MSDPGTTQPPTQSINPKIEVWLVRLGLDVLREHGMKMLMFGIWLSGLWGLNWLDQRIDAKVNAAVAAVVMQQEELHIHIDESIAELERATGAGGVSIRSLDDRIDIEMGYIKETLGRHEGDIRDLRNQL